MSKIPIFPMNNSYAKSLVEYSSDEESGNEENCEIEDHADSEKFPKFQTETDSIRGLKNVFEALEDEKIEAAQPCDNLCNPVQMLDNETSQTNTSWEPLPLPFAVQCMFGDTSSTGQKEASEQHGGKIRSFPHERGVWATFVFIEYIPNPEFFELIDDFVKICKAQGITISKTHNFHVSLSRTLKLRHHWIQVFIDALKAELVHFHRFKLMLQSTEVYTNDEKTRTFLGLKVHFGMEYLSKISQKIDKCLQEFKLPFFYHEPSFHLSFASCVGDVAEKVELFMADINVAYQSFVEVHPQCRTLWVTKVQCKSGNKLFTIPLKT